MKKRKLPQEIIHEILGEPKNPGDLIQVHFAVDMAERFAKQEAKREAIAVLDWAYNNAIFENEQLKHLLSPELYTIFNNRDKNEKQ